MPFSSSPHRLRQASGESRRGAAREGGRAAQQRALPAAGCPLPAAVSRHCKRLLRPWRGPAAVVSRSNMSAPTLIMAGLEFRNVRKSFGAVQALKGVSFSVADGEGHALVGENSAGNSTLLNILAR